MTSIVNFMEKLGSTAGAKQLTAAELLTMLAEQGINVNANDSLVEAVELAVDARSNVVCGVFPAEEPGKEQPDDDSEDDKKEPESRLVVNG